MEAAGQFENPQHSRECGRPVELQAHVQAAEVGTGRYIDWRRGIRVVNSG